MRSQNNKNKTIALTYSLSKDQRWSADRKREAVMRILRESVEILFRKVTVEINRLAKWHAKALAATNSSLISGPTLRAHHSRASPPQGLNRASSSRWCLGLAQAGFADC